ncbi:MAG: gliding motility-associated C-terminal domain-containing protein [Crocinitomicaceae bacterium]|nr:gliding motility-associated C-terminal domain-containing protein [Crocinitomicaceae bacterium]
MRTPLLVVALFVLVPPVVGQLVNPGFEVCSAFPTAVGQWHLVQGWNNAGSSIASPDYFNYLGNFEADIPETPVAIVNSFEGDAIMGFIACGRKNSNIREYITAVFSEPLKTGRNYTISFKITNGHRTDVSTAGLGVADIGMYFSVSQPSQSEQDPLIASPQFQIAEVLYSPEWKNINFVLHADQPYLFMTIGLFGDDADKQIVEIYGENPHYAYYFVDDFSLQILPNDNAPLLNPGQKETINNTVEVPLSPAFIQPFYVPNTFTPNGDGNNDVFKPVAGFISEWEFSVYNRWGERVFFSTDEDKGWDGSSNSRLSDNGTYIWEITFSRYDKELGLRKMEQRGIVNLVR